MKKNVLFALICAGVMGFAVSSCSSDDNDLVAGGIDVEVICKFTDIISDINGETGVVYKDYFDGNMYIDAADGNRYYLMDDNERPIDDNGVLGLTTVERLEGAGILAERNVVKFSGKVYGADERWIESLQWRLEKYGWNEYARLYQVQLELPTVGHTFCLVAPDFTIENAE